MHKILVPPKAGPLEEQNSLGEAAAVLTSAHRPPFKKLALKDGCGKMHIDRALSCYFENHRKLLRSFKIK